jgi:hypothetical protein
MNPKQDIRKAALSLRQLAKTIAVLPPEYHSDQELMRRCRQASQAVRDLADYILNHVAKNQE